MKVTWTTTALRRLDGYAQEIARDDRKRARAWVDEVFAAVARLEQFPESGRIVPEFGKPGIRELICRNYRIVDSIRRRRVYVRTVRHVKQRFSLS
jgi:plasmid stabilization system protein ParE